MADMMRVVSPDIAQVNLMVAADVDSLRALKRSDADELAMLLHHVNQARTLVKETPDLVTVRKWKQEARAAKSRIKLAWFI